jgi:RimJ/RimL family protein N-acetyltransferase
MPSTAHFPGQPTLVGDTLILRPLRAEDFVPLYQAASDPLIWEQHPDPNRYQRGVFEANFFAPAMAGGSALVVVDRDSNQIIGSSRFYEWDPAKREVAIGYTFLSRSHWGGETNREMKTLMLAHAFRLAQRVWFHVGANNLRSRKAMEKIGGVLTHLGEKTLFGVSHPYAFYAIDAADFATAQSSTA